MLQYRPYVGGHVLRMTTLTIRGKNPYLLGLKVDRIGVHIKARKESGIPSYYDVAPGDDTVFRCHRHPLPRGQRAKAERISPAESGHWHAQHATPMFSERGTRGSHYEGRFRQTQI